MPIRFEVTRQIQAPPERVFRALTDLDTAGEWMPGHVRVERLGDGELRAGSEWRETRKVLGREATEQFEVTRWEPPTRLGLRVDGRKGSSRRGEYLFDYRLAPRDGGTLVTLDGEIRGFGRLMELVGKLLAGPYRKACAKDLTALAAHLEGGRTTSA